MPRTKGVFVMPKNSLYIPVTVLNSYHLIDKAISGESVTSMEAGQTYTFYKRFQYDPNGAALYLTLTHYHDGQATKAYFLLETASDSQPEHQ